MPTSISPSSHKESLGLRKIDSLHYYVRDLDRSRRFYVDLMDFREIGGAAPELERRGKQRSAVFQAGDCRIVCSEPRGEGGAAWRYLRRHPDGVGTIVFEVEDATHAFRLLEERGATPTGDVETFSDDGGTLKTFTIATPFGDTIFRFLERKGAQALYPGFETRPVADKGNRFGFESIDHVTSNFLTMKPMLLWMEHVMGFQPFWDVTFHTNDVKQQSHGSGLRSQVMVDHAAGIKFANNEPLRPDFRASQIYKFVEDNRGEGVQHAALTCPDLISTVRGLRKSGVEFMPTPPSYYDMLPNRLEETSIGKVDEDHQVLRELQVLVDGDGPGKYMLQIFLRDAAGLYRESDAGPFFYEIIQRKGDKGFGAGNFRALFESIEREQTKTTAGAK